MTRTIRTGLIVMILAALAAPVSAQRQGGGQGPGGGQAPDGTGPTANQLSITKVVVASDDVTLLIEGANIGATPAVSVDAQQLTVLASTATSIIAVLQAPLAKGSYRLTASTGTGPTRRRHLRPHDWGGGS